MRPGRTPAPGMRLDAVRGVTDTAFFNPKEVGCAGQAPVMEERTE